MLQPDCLRIQFSVENTDFILWCKILLEADELKSMWNISQQKLILKKKGTAEFPLFY